MRPRSAPRWELDPASSEDYGERVRAYDAYRSGERFRRWMADVGTREQGRRPLTQPGTWTSNHT